MSAADLEPAGASAPVRWRGPLLWAAVLAALAGAAIPGVALPEILRLSLLAGWVFAVVVVAQLAALLALVARPTRRRALGCAAPALAMAVLWGLVRVGHALPAPDPWQPVDAVIGFTDYLCAALELVAIVLLAVLASHGPGRPSSPVCGVVRWIAAAPLFALLLGCGGIGVAAASDGFQGTGVPMNASQPAQATSGSPRTVEYCRPGRVPLAMDLYPPTAASRGAHPVPVALYVHGGGVLGDRKMVGLGAMLANHAGALFTPLREQLGARGFLVAAIDYRLAPAAPWPAQIEDVKCAVRFLRAHATTLGVDPDRIGVWGSSGGGQLASLLGLAGTGAGFDVGQYPGQSSRVQAVVDMFGPADLTDFSDSGPFGRLIAQLAFGGSPTTRRAASPATYPAPGDPPFLILTGLDDPLVRPRQSIGLAARLRAAGGSVTLLQVQGAGHQLDNLAQHPAPAELTAAVADFLTSTLR